MLIVLLKSVIVWFAIVIAAIFNGVFRENVLFPLFGKGLALPLSGVFLSLLVFFITLIFLPFIGRVKTSTYFAVGMLWVLLTLAFEFLFGHYVIGKTWHEISQTFCIWKGDLFLVVLFIAAISPWLAAKMMGFLQT